MRDELTEQIDALLAEIPARGWWEANDALKSDPHINALAKRPPAERVALAEHICAHADRWPRRPATLAYLTRRLLQRNKALSVSACLAVLQARTPTPNEPWFWEEVERYVLQRFVKEARAHGAGEEGVAFAEQWLDLHGDRQMSARPSPITVAMRQIVEQGPDAPDPGPPEPLRTAMATLLALPGGAEFAALATSVGSRSKPTKTWEKAIRTALDAGLTAPVREGLSDWLASVDPQPELPAGLVEPLKGLLWASAFVADDAVVRAIVAWVQRCFVKISGVGARHPTLGTAGIRALSFAPAGLGADGLFTLQGTLRYPSARDTVERVLGELQARTGLDRRGLALRSPTGHPVDAEYAECWTHPIAEWRSWFAEHPDREDDTQDALWWLEDRGQRALVNVDADGTLWDLDGAPVAPTPAATLQLWHPVETDDALTARAEARIDALDLPRGQIGRPRLRPAPGSTRGDRRLLGSLVNAWPFERAARARGWAFSLSAMYSGDMAAVRMVGAVAAQLVLEIPDTEDNASDAAFPPWKYMRVLELRILGTTLSDLPPRVASEAALAAQELVEVSARLTSEAS